MDRRAIATQIRARAELLQKSDPRSPFGKDLREMCAICSIALARSFLAAGYYAKPMFGYFYQYPDRLIGRNHCWVLVQTATRDEIITERWDITVTQFDKSYPPVTCFVGHDDFHYEEVYQLSEPSDEEFWRRWPKHQRPTEDMLNRITNDAFVVS